MLLFASRYCSHGREAKVVLLLIYHETSHLLTLVYPAPYFVVCIQGLAILSFLTRGLVAVAPL